METQELKIVAKKRAEGQKRKKYVTNPDETKTDTENEESDCLFLDRFFGLRRGSAAIEMTHVSLNEFRSIWSALSDKVQIHWNNG